MQVPFTIGDESQGKAVEEEKEETALYAVEDMVVPPRSGYMVPAKPREGALTAWEMWAVKPRTDAETEELQRSLEREEEWHRRLEARVQGQCSIEAERLKREERHSAKWDDGVREMEKAVGPEAEETVGRAGSDSMASDRGPVRRR